MAEIMDRPTVGYKSVIGGSSPKPTPGSGRGGISNKRHKKMLRNNIEGITKGSIRRLSRRGGVKRIGSKCYDTTRDVLSEFVRNMVHDAVCYVEYRGAMTVTAQDILMALKRRGATMYGALDLC